MLTTLRAAVRIEWLKQRRSLAGWLVVLGGLFVPGILFAFLMYHRATLPATYATGTFWEMFWTRSWESISIMMLPLESILLVSLLVHIEYRNNTWKQVHASPLPLAAVFTAKLAVILFRVLQFLVVINLGLFAAALLPLLLVKGAAYPAGPLPLTRFLVRNLYYFVDLLPVIGFQYLLALRCRNVLVPLGVGLALWVVSVGMLSSGYGYLIPYGYDALRYLVDAGAKQAGSVPVPIEPLALACFALTTAAAAALYLARRDRG